RFAQQQGVQDWQSVTRRTLEAYGAWLDDRGYSGAAEYLELTCLKQMLKWLIAEKHIPESCKFAMSLKKPQGTTTYCYSPEEVDAMVSHCFNRRDLAWLGDIVIGLATTGLRISELAALRWTDVDLDHDLIRLTDTRYHDNKEQRAAARTT